MPLVQAVESRLRRLQRTDWLAMNEMSFKVFVIASLHDALATEHEHDDECASSKHRHELGDRFRYELQSELEVIRDADPGARKWWCERRGFVDLAVQRTDLAVRQTSGDDSDTGQTVVVMIIELKYLSLIYWITNPKADSFKRQYFMHPVEQGAELERRKALQLECDEPTLLAQRFERLDNGNADYKRLASTSVFDSATCTQSKTDYYEQDAAILPVLAWLELAKLQAASYRLRPPVPPTLRIVRWAIVGVGARVVADMIATVDSPPVLPWCASPSSWSASLPSSPLLPSASSSSLSPSSSLFDRRVVAAAAEAEAAAM